MRIALGLEYDGSRFLGWQTQPGGGAVQDALEPALAAIAGEPRRRDRGRPHRSRRACARAGRALRYRRRAAATRAWVRGVNALPARIGRRAVGAAGRRANSMRAIAPSSRTYRYVLLNRAGAAGARARPVGWYHPPLDLAKMREAAAHLVGEHDFSAFRSAECQAKTPVRTLHALGHRGARRRASTSSCARTRSCTTWCATSSARWSTSARASIRRRGSRDVLAFARPEQGGADIRARGSCTSRRSEYDPRWGLPAMRTRIKICGITRAGRRARRGAGRRRRDRPGVLSAEPALSLGRARGRDARRAAAVRADGGAVREPGRARRSRRCSARAPGAAAVSRRGDAASSARSSACPFVKAVPQRCQKAGVDALEYLRPFSRAAAWLLDSHVPEYGGVGEGFDLVARAGRDGAAAHSFRRARRGERGRGHPARAPLGRGRVERRRIGEGHQGRRENRRFHRGGQECGCMTCPTRAAISGPTGACSSPRRSPPRSTSCARPTSARARIPRSRPSSSTSSSTTSGARARSISRND